MLHVLLLQVKTAVHVHTGREEATATAMSESYVKSECVGLLAGLHVMPAGF